MNNELTFTVDPVDGYIHTGGTYSITHNAPYRIVYTETYEDADLDAYESDSLEAVQYRLGRLIESRVL